MSLARLRYLRRCVEDHRQSEPVPLHAGRAKGTLRIRLLRFAEANQSRGSQLAAVSYQFQQNVRHRELSALAFSCVRSRFWQKTRSHRKSGSSILFDTIRPTPAAQNIPARKVGYTFGRNGLRNLLFITAVELELRTRLVDQAFRASYRQESHTAGIPPTKESYRQW